MKNVFHILLLLAFCNASGQMPAVSGNPAVSRTDSVILLAPDSGTILSEYVLAPGIVALPMTDAAGIRFHSARNLIGWRVSVFDASGKLVLQRLIGGENSLDLTILHAGDYEIRFDDAALKPLKLRKK